MHNAVILFESKDVSVGVVLNAFCTASKCSHCGDV